jgi:hypothetical protein
MIMENVYQALAADNGIRGTLAGALLVPDLRPVAEHQEAWGASGGGGISSDRNVVIEEARILAFEQRPKRAVERADSGLQQVGACRASSTASADAWRSAC